MFINRNILIIAQPTWDGDYMKAVVELAKRMAEGNRVLYVEAPDTYHPHHKRKKSVLLERSVKNGKLYTFTPSPVIPVNGLPDGHFYNMMNHINNTLLFSQLDRVIKKLKFHKPILINGLSPFYGKQILGRYHETSRTYFCYDDITGREWNKRHGVRLEKEIQKKYDLTVCTSRELLKIKGGRSKNSTVIHNGVDSDLFGKIRRKTNGITRIGFIGSIDERVDLKLIDSAALLQPNWEFLFVGRVTVDTSAVITANNVHFIGSKSPNELPEYLQTFDVGLIPFVKDQFTKSIYPIKVNEYLCAGIPVISTPFSFDILDFKDCVEIVQSPQELISAALKAKENKWKCTEYDLRQRGRLADWSIRAVQFLSEIEMIEQPGV